jgi:hypothetical protein
MNRVEGAHERGARVLVGDSTRDSMSAAYESLVQAALLFAAIFVLTAVVLAVARSLRSRPNDDTRDASEIMANFRQVYEEGGLSDEEFRTIKARLARELKAADQNSQASA